MRISYLKLLNKIVNGENIDLIELKLNCGSRYYQAYYDDGEFSYFGLCNQDEEDENFNYYLANTLLESQMFEDNIEIIENDDLIPKHLSNQFIQQLDKQDIKCIAHKVNEIINYLQHISKGE